jgi:hypothetical protein
VGGRGAMSGLSGIGEEIEDLERDIKFHTNKDQIHNLFLQFF